MIAEHLGGFVERHSRVISVTALLAATGFVVVALVALTYNLDRVRESFGWVQHTDDVLLKATAIEGNLIAAESGERGYLLTGNKDYSDAVDRAGAAIETDLTSTHALVADNPAQLQRVDALRGTIEARLAQFQRVVALGPEHLGDAVDVIRAAAPQQLTEQAREQLLAFRQVELELLQERQHDAGAGATRATLLAAGTTIVALLSAGFGLLLFQRERDRHRERELQSELIHFSRLNLMGQTASMLAHELNQPLTAAGNYLAAMRATVRAEPAPPRVGESLDKATAQITRAGQIVDRLRAFIKRGEPEKTVEQVDDVIAEAVALSNLKRDGLELTTQVDGALPEVLVDKIQIEQVLINLMRNAVEAMQQRERRLLQLSADRFGAMARIVVKDNGTGLAPDVADKLFRPFVSTKKAGMGVGLSICRAIVERNGGRIWVEENSTAGAAFAFTLPLAAPPEREI